MTLVEDGVWSSSDERILAEHGHQIGWDPNRYGDWPDITKDFGGKTYVRRPWGEQFVQKLFNDAERSYPLVDNLSPNSAGARYRMQDRGIAGSARDIARFLRFNLMDTSWRQKLAMLGEAPDSGETPSWDLPRARSQGHRLFLEALPPEDPVAASMQGEDADAAALRRELDALARDEEAVDDSQVSLICDELAAKGKSALCRDPTLGSPVLKPGGRPTLGGAVEGFWPRERVVGPHVKERWDDQRRVRTFVYGHTHTFEKTWETDVNSLVTVTILNDGAFQRVVDDDKFRALAKRRGISSGEAMRRIPLDDLPACYTFVRIVPGDGGLPDISLQAWLMPEDAAAGEVVDVCDPRCADVGRGCPAPPAS